MTENNGRWSTEEDQFLREHAIRGYPWLSENMGRSHGSVRRRAQALKIRVRYVHPHDWTEEENDVIRENYLLERGRLTDLLPGRSAVAIRLQAWRIGCANYLAGGAKGERKRVSGVPYAVGPRRKLLAQTCHDCGKFKVAGQFERWSMVCIQCRSAKRAPQNAVIREKLQAATLPAKRSGMEWTSEENEELKRAWEKKENYVIVAKRMGRTYNAVTSRITQVIGVRARPSRTEERQWLLWFAEPEPRPEFEWDDEEIGA